ncbi:MAG: hypothetical protein JXB24_01260 [Bacteroidales bacterium]|nr:hypothetical protein [Bacteroidales bacterium]
MKNVKSLIINCIVLLFTAYTICSAQAPGKMNYQAVLRDASGEILKNSHVTLTILILQGSSSGSAVFSETHSTSTNAFGLANLEIGSEDPTGFAGIDWTDGPYYVKIRVNGTEMGTSELLSVPYALYAKEAGGTGSSVWSESGDNIYYNNGNVGINASDPKSKLSVGSNGRSNSSFFTYNNQPDGKGLTSDASGERGYAVYGESWGLNGMAIVGHAMNYHENSNFGGYFRTDGTEGIGVFGWATNDGRNRNIGGWFNARGELGIGVLASSPYVGGNFSATGENAYAGVIGSASNNKVGANYGGYFTADKYGVYGEASSTEVSFNYGGYFKALGDNSYGVYGQGNVRGGCFVASKDNGTVSYGVIGIAESTSTIRNYGGTFTAKGVNGVGVKGEADNSKGKNNWGGYFTANGTGGIGSYNISSGMNGIAVKGVATQTSSAQEFNYGGYFQANGPQGVGVYAKGNGWAGYFDGLVEVDGGVESDYVECGSLVAAVKFFRIDHPLYPETHYLSHTSVESSQMMNMYTGNVVLDQNGKAWVELPEWFEALNKDFTYQLTCINGFAQVYIASEIQDNRFKIAGGQEGLKVSWQVTGVRHDKYVEEHPLQVEQRKNNQ